MGAQRAFDEIAVEGFVAGQCGVQSARQQAFGQIVNLVEALTVADHQLALDEQLFQGDLGRFPVPAPGIIGALCRVFKILGLERALGAHPRKHRIHSFAIRTAPVALTGGDGMHVAPTVAVILHGQISRRMGPVFEYPALVLKLIQMRGPVARHARPQAVMMRALNHRDRVDLYVTQLLDAAVHRLLATPEQRPRMQALADQRQPPRIM